MGLEAESSRVVREADGGIVRGEVVVVVSACTQTVWSQACRLDCLGKGGGLMEWGVVVSSKVDKHKRTPVVVVAARESWPDEISR